VYFGTYVLHILLFFVSFQLSLLVYHVYDLMLVYHVYDLMLVYHVYDLMIISPRVDRKQCK